MIRHGIDVASPQGVVDTDEVRAASVLWFACKVTDGKMGLDPYGSGNVTKANRSRFPIKLAYHFLRYGDDAYIDAQSTEYIEQWRRLGLSVAHWGAMCDAEADRFAGGKHVTLHMVQRWVVAIESFTGRPCAIYTGLYVDGGAIYKWARDTNRPVIVAAYVTLESLTTRVTAAFGDIFYMPDAWQYTDEGTCPGVRGMVDLDQVFRWPQFERACGLPPGGSLVLPTTPNNQVKVPLVLAPYSYPTGDSGKLKDSDLVYVPGEGRFVMPAARAWNALRDGLLKATGLHLDYTARGNLGGTYRSYVQQVAMLKARAVRGVPQGGQWSRFWRADPQGPATWYGKKGMAACASPGQSNHGWGLAVDAALDPDQEAGGPVVGITPALPWLTDNARRYGWSWESQAEPWHLRYVDGDSIPKAVLDYEDSLRPPDPGPEPEPILIGDQVIYILKPGPAVYAWAKNPAWIAAFSSGAMRHAIGQDGQWADANKIPSYEVNNVEWYLTACRVAGIEGDAVAPK